jgi:hypothetical protein
MAETVRLRSFKDLEYALKIVCTGLGGLEQEDLSDRQFHALVSLDSLLFDALMILDSLSAEVKARALDGKKLDPDLMEGNLIVDWYLSGPGAGTLRSDRACDLGERVRDQIVDGLAYGSVAGELTASQGDDLYGGWWKIPFESDIQ